MDKPQFIDIDKDQIIDELVADYELATGKKLQPGQVEQLLINAFAYREYLLRTAIQQTAEQNLVSFANAPALDFLGELLGVFRLPPSFAGTVIRFTLVDGHNGLTIPEGLRVQSLDGQAVFVTTEEKYVAQDVLTVDVKAQCNAEGLSGNGYAPDQVSVILDPQPYLTGATNLTETGGGANEESDEELRERIRLAPSQFSTAGPDGAYKFFAKSAHPSIIDVAVTSPLPGDVHIYPLLIGGESPSQDVIDAVYATCNDEKVRPLTDSVYVYPPLVENYNIEISLKLLTDTVATPVINKVNANLQAYADKRKMTMGLDVVLSQIIGQASIDGVYSVEVISPASNIVVPPDTHAVCGDITVNLTGYSDE